MKITKTVRDEIELFAARAEAIFEVYNFKWMGDGQEYVPNRAQILDSVYRLIDRAGEIFDEHSDIPLLVQEIGRLVVVAYRPPESSDILSAVTVSLDIT